MTMRSKFNEIFIVGLTLLFFTQGVKSQDQIFLKNDNKIKLAKVIAIGLNDISYKNWPIDEMNPLFYENKKKIRKIIFENGTVLKFVEDEFSDTIIYNRQKRFAIKIDPLAVTRGVLSISGEYSIYPRISIEQGLGYIGLKKYNNSSLLDITEANGFFFRIGLKIIKKPKIKLKEMRYPHLLKGSYLKPELVYLKHNTIEYLRTDYTIEQKITGGGFFLNLGKQWVIKDIFLVDLFFGPGLAIKDGRQFENGKEYQPRVMDFTTTGSFAFLTFSRYYNQVGFSSQFGVKVGCLIGVNKK